jgi:hypothetical protein
MLEESVETAVTPVVTKRSRKLGKMIEGTVLTITESVTGSKLVFNFADLPAAIQANLGPYGLSQKLGDAAAGKEGQEAVDSINKIFEGLMKGDWSVRAPAAEKITKKDLAEKIALLPKKEQEIMRAAFEKLGVKL